MSLCYKCNKSIKPASLATTVKGERYHPTCLFCSICERPLWGRPFKKSSDGSLVCDQSCEPQARPVSVDKKSITSRPSSAQKQQQFLIEQAKQNTEANKQHLDLEKYRKPLLATQITENKFCQACNQNLINKRFITFENGEMLCQDCEDRMKNPVMAQNKSGNSVECFICRKAVQGTKYITEKNGDVICENCELNGARCDKCNQLFKPNEVIRRLDFDIKYHDHCFNCKSCHKLIHSEQFFLDDSKKFPICSDCEQLSKLPKCTVCNVPINGPHLIFDEKPIHNVCLKCSGCGKNLDNDGGDDSNGYFKDKNCGLPLCFNCNLERYGKNAQNVFRLLKKMGSLSQTKIITFTVLHVKAAGQI
ncbi:four and a half LIM domains 2 [Brachionus plicatilis]|uniref:Four and a half LIM domains 2 n=1 Tax=Brachionus plicatilis TaxID=10195 RepID=A0A3M7P463_BRAPC|nr:four and a half LIM domains 2 [Brachionus plicatilis]